MIFLNGGKKTSQYHFLPGKKKATTMKNPLTEIYFMYTFLCRPKTQIFHQIIFYRILHSEILSWYIKYLEMFMWLYSTL